MHVCWFTSFRHLSRFWFFLVNDNSLAERLEVRSRARGMQIKLFAVSSLRISSQCHQSKIPHHSTGHCYYSRRVGWRHDAVTECNEAWTALIRLLLQVPHISLNAPAHTSSLSFKWQTCDAGGDSDNNSGGDNNNSNNGKAKQNGNSVKAQSMSEA